MNTGSSSITPPGPAIASTPGTLTHRQVVLDAAVWVSAAIPQEQQHALSRQWINRYLSAGGELIVPEWFIVEVSAAIGRRVGPQHGQRAYLSVYSLAQLTLLPMSGNLMQGSAAVASALQLRAGDAVYVAVTQQLNIPLVTWDAEIAQRAGTTVLVVDPNNFPW